MSKDKLDYLVWSAKDKINHIVTAPGATVEEAHEAIQELRAFLEARAAQTATPFVPPGSELPYSPKAPPVRMYAPDLALADLIGAPASAPEVDPELAALL